MKITCCKGYVYNKIWSEKLIRDWGYIPISKNLIENAEKIIRKKGAKVKIIRDDGIRRSQDYLFQESLIRINLPSTAPHLELHSETKKDLTKLIKELGLPDN
jgi:hypothetical protein